MTEQERKKMMNLADTITGEINRICVTKDLSELDAMCWHAKINIDRLTKMVYETRFREGLSPVTDEEKRYIVNDVLVVK